MGAKKNRDGPNKSEFIRDILKKNKKATIGDVKQAWDKAGHKDELNHTLYYQVRRSLGLAKKRGRGKSKRSNNRVPAAESATTQSSYERVEAAIDDLLGHARDLKDSQLAEHLLQARRRVSAKLVTK